MIPTLRAKGTVIPTALKRHSNSSATTPTRSETDTAAEAAAVAADRRVANHSGATMAPATPNVAAMVKVPVPLLSVSASITVAPAVSHFANGLETQPTCPWLVVQGYQDELVPIDETIDWFNDLKPGPELAVLPDAEHFFHGRLVDLREVVTEFVQKKAGENPGS